MATRAYHRRQTRVKENTAVQKRCLHMCKSNQDGTRVSIMRKSTISLVYYLHAPIFTFPRVIIGRCPWASQDTRRPWCRRRDSRARRTCCRTRQCRSASSGPRSSAWAARPSRLGRRPCHPGCSRRRGSCRWSAGSKPDCSRRFARLAEWLASGLCSPCRLESILKYSLEFLLFFRRTCPRTIFSLKFLK